MKQDPSTNLGGEDPVQNRWVLGGGLATAFAATLCCVGPLLFAGLGLGAFTAAGFFHELRPYLIGLALACVAAAWFWDWRRHHTTSGDTGDKDSICEMSCRSRSRKGLIIFTIVVVSLSASPYLLDSWMGNLYSMGTDPDPTGRVAGLNVWDADLAGLHCPACVPGLEQAFKKLDGVGSVSVSYRPPKALIRYHSSSVNPEQFREIVESYGYAVASTREK
jgi:copper chaperone CopZ